MIRSGPRTAKIRAEKMDHGSQSETKFQAPTLSAFVPIPWQPSEFKAPMAVRLMERPTGVAAKAPGVVLTAKVLMEFSLG